MVKKKPLEKLSKKKSVVKEEVKVSKKKPRCLLNFMNSKVIISLGITVLVILVIVLSLVLPAEKANAGDTVSVLYVGSLEDGSVFDTNIEEVAVEYGLERPSYDLLTFTLGDGSMISGFDTNVDGMKVGKTKTFILTPEESYGEGDPELVFDLPLIQELESESSITLEQFNSLFAEDPVLNEVLSTEDWPWDVKVLDFNEENVTLENLLSVGDVLNLETVTWESEVIEVGEVIKILQHPEIGGIFYLPNGMSVMQGSVIEIGDNEFTVDFNSPLAGKNLIFEVTLVSIA